MKDGAEKGVHHAYEVKTILKFTRQQVKKAPDLKIHVLNTDIYLLLWGLPQGDLLMTSKHQH